MPRTAGTTRRMRAVLAAGLATAVLGPVGATSAAAADPPFVPGPAVSVLGEYTPIPGDFDGDGRDDIAWYRPGTGRDHLWQGTADGFVEGPRVNVDGNYTPIPGDFDGDGRDDILWNGFGAAPDPLWRGTPSGFTPGPTQTVNGWYAAIVGDFDGDTRDDVLWYRAGSWPDYLWRGTASGFRQGPKVSVVGTYRPESGDFDGDGRDDIYWDTTALGAPDRLWRGAAVAAPFALGPSFSPVEYFPDSVPGDFDGSGTVDLLWYRFDLRAKVARGTVDGFADVATPDLADWATPIPGDFDGNGTDDLLWYNPGSGADWLQRGS